MEISLAFQSTSPYAGDDGQSAIGDTLREDFNPRPPTRGTTPAGTVYVWLPDISIHVPLRGGRPVLF